MSKQLGMNVSVMFLWAFLKNSMASIHLATGFLIGAVAIFIICRMRGSRFYLWRVGRVVRLLLVFLREIIISNFQVACQVLHPDLPVRPGFIAIPLDIEGHTKITLLAILVTMTPGTLSVDVSEDEKHLIVHVLNLENADETKSQIKETFEKGLMEVFVSG